MIDPQLKIMLIRAFTGGVIGLVVGLGMRLTKRNQPDSASLDQVCAIGFLVGTAFGATFGIFESMINP